MLITIPWLVLIILASAVLGGFGVCLLVYKNRWAALAILPRGAKNLLAANTGLWRYWG